ncbi:MAG: uracil-DNA glycosylase [Pseudomonadota bacterium]|nr:uracil-DNA glycosylase [Pseudomonadota bacterium]
MMVKRGSKSSLYSLDALRWHIEMGVDELIDDNSVDRYSAVVKTTVAASEIKAPPAPLIENTEATRQVSGSGLAPAEGARDAIEVAAGAGTLEELRKRLEAFDGCALKFTATNTVFADGEPGADLMFIGEAPGVDEDRQGLPFVGASGQLLNQMLRALGRDRSSVYITNILFWRPPGNRSPSATETAACLPFVRRHVELARPKVLVFLGGSAAKTMLDRSQGIMRLRGKWFDYISDGLNSPIPAMPTFHPAFLLRQPAQKREAWHDFLAIQEKLGELG